MNFAFVTLVIFILLLPGFFYMAAYHRGKFSRRYSRNSIYSDVARAIVPSILFHALASILIKRNTFCLEVDIAFDSLGIILTGNNSDERISAIFNHSIGEFIPHISLYVILSIIFGYLFGYIVVSTIRYCHLDLRYPSLRFDNEWYYPLSGEILGFDKKRLRRFNEFKEQLFVHADVLCNIGGNLYIYNGIVSEFYLDENGLDNLYLEKAHRRGIDTKKDDENGRTYMANTLLIPSQSIVNLHLNYWEKDKKPITPIVPKAPVYDPKNPKSGDLPK